jgi:hypothetical protein
MEINALSGLSSHSALPIIAAQAGMSFEMLVDGIIWDAFARSQSSLRDEKYVKYKSFRNTTGLSLHP